jgi:hypothetical protein
MLSDEQINSVKDFVFRNGRLLERRLFECFFENGTPQACIKALLAYQNPDGGFGNGVEPDLLCPDSTAIGAETAMFVLDILDDHDAELIKGLTRWTVASQTDAGIIPHPPENMFNYPHQPWWQNPDDERVLVLAGLFKKWGVDEPDLFHKVRRYYLQMALPEEDSFYSYPLFVYLQYCSETEKDRAQLAKMVERLPVLLEKHRDHFPLFSRYWYHARDFVDREALTKEAQVFSHALQQDGGIKSPYPDLPWWRPIFTLDGLIEGSTSDLTGYAES